MDKNNAPKYSIKNLDPLVYWFEKHGLDMSGLNGLLDFFEEKDVQIRENPDEMDNIADEMFKKVLPYLNQDFFNIIFQKILDGEVSSELLPPIIPYMSSSLISMIEAAVVYGKLDSGLLKYIRTDEVP